MVTKNCPCCDSEIPERAKICPLCQSSIEEKTRWRRARQTAGRVVREISPWLALPVAIVAFVTALFNPIAGTFLGWFGADGARISFNVIDIPANFFDAPQAGASEGQEDEIFLRGILANDGFSLATIGSVIFCNLKFEDGSERAVSFEFYDPRDRINIHPFVEPRSATTYFAKYGAVGEVLPGDELSRCYLLYNDKYTDSSGSKESSANLSPNNEDNLRLILPHDDKQSGLGRENSKSSG